MGFTRLGAIIDVHLRTSSGSLAMFAAIRRASSRVSSLAADLRADSFSNKHTQAAGRRGRELGMPSSPRRFPPPWSDFFTVPSVTALLFTIVTLALGATHGGNPMRYIIFISVILAAMVVAKTVNLPRGATASHNEINDTMNVRQLKQTVEEK